MNAKKNFLELLKQCMLVCLVGFVISFGAVNAFGQDGAQDNVLYSDIDSASLDTQNIPAAAPPSGTLPVYRFFNTETGTHFYTISEEEKNHILATWPQFHLDGPAFYAYPIDTTTPPPSCSPNSGMWSGNNFSFTVSSAKTSLNAWELIMPISGTYCNYNRIDIYGGSSSISITQSNCGFSKSGTESNGGTYSVTGSFTNATTASGTYSYSNNYLGCFGSGTWTTTY